MATMDMRVVRGETTREEWKSIILACRSSGMTVRAWCQENGIKESSYYYWLKEVRHELLILREESRELGRITPAFCELTSASDELLVSLQLNGLTLSVEPTATVATVRAAISVLRSLC
jgi:transposase-like protein